MPKYKLTATGKGYTTKQTDDIKKVKASLKQPNISELIKIEETKQEPLTDLYEKKVKINIKDMPYIIRKVRNKDCWEVINKETGIKHSKCTSKLKADAQLKILMEKDGLIIDHGLPSKTQEKKIEGRFRVVPKK